MGSIEGDGNRIGLAGEFRVMSELLLRGHNPAKSYLENGADLVLENGLRVEVKSTHKLPQKRSHSYCFNFGNAGKKRLEDLNFNFVVCWCIDEDCFYIIPKQEIKAKTIGIYTIASNKSKYAPYKENWNLLKREG